MLKVLKSQEFDRSDQVKGHPRTTLDYVCLIGLFLFINTISELVLIQKRQINFNENGTVVASHHIV